MSIFSFIHAPVTILRHAGLFIIHLITFCITVFHLAAEGLVFSFRLLENMLIQTPPAQSTPPVTTLPSLLPVLYSLLPQSLAETGCKLEARTGQAVHSSGPPYEHITIKHEANSERFSPDRVERRRKMLEEMKRSFPNGVPDPNVPLDTQAMDRLPFVRATVEMFSDDNLESQLFTDVWCLWRTGAHGCHILSSKLAPGLKHGQDSDGNGYVAGDILFEGSTKAITASFAYKEDLPNDVDFIILGQKGVIDSIEARITPRYFEPPPLANKPNHYGTIHLLRYHDPVTDEITNL